jgi:hypothetical protein
VGTSAKFVASVVSYLDWVLKSVIAIDKHGKQQYHARIRCRVTAFLRKMFHDCDGIDFISDFEGVSVTCSSPRINQAKESEMNCTFKEVCEVSNGNRA